MQQTKVSEAIKDKKMFGIDGTERNVSEFFSDADFQFNNDKLFVSHASLLRVARKAFGILNYEIDFIGLPEKTNEWCATIKVKYTHEKFHCEAIADCKTSNASRGFERYTTALAETRASARALRNMLGIEFCSAEEVVDLNNVVSNMDSESIDDTQIMLITKKFFGEKGKQLKDIVKIIDRDVAELKELKKSEAIKILETLNKKEKEKVT